MAANDTTLRSIRYKRGSLQLLDRSAVRDMVVRGAPAIAIAAALLLAVEVFYLSEFDGTSDDAVSFLDEKLEFLVSSRPTAVNLSDAATILKEIIAKGAASSEPGNIFQLVSGYRHAKIPVLRLHRMLAAFCQNLCYKIVASSSNGYGTALGVIRPLHDDGYCTETRPFNQIPATLIADSAAAALMKDCQVSAVIVGADRVAANGDTANKIGTYSLALCAKHHNFPFFVAAPLSSVDLSLSSGKQIVIEERSPKELLHARGGLGEQVAATEISVWNPAFDVTPANLISGIITEKGVITKDGDHFDIKQFVEQSSGL